MLSKLALHAIRFYQRHLSPLKGYRCAYGLASGRPSCSAMGARGFRRAGFVGGWLLLQRQFDRCALAAASLRAERTRQQAGRYLRWRHSQRGFVDCDCAGADCAPDCSPDCAPDCTPDCGQGSAGTGSRLLRILDCLSWADCGSCSSSDSSRQQSRAAAASARQETRQRRRDERRKAADEQAAD